LKEVKLWQPLQVPQPWEVFVQQSTGLINTINHPATKGGGPRYAVQVSGVWLLISHPLPQGRSSTLSSQRVMFWIYAVVPVHAIR